MGIINNQDTTILGYAVDIARGSPVLTSRPSRTSGGSATRKFPKKAPALGLNKASPCAVNGNVAMARSSHFTVAENLAQCFGPA